MPSVDQMLRWLLANAVISASNEIFFTDLVGTGTPSVPANGTGSAADVSNDIADAAALMTLSAGSKSALFAPGSNMPSLASKVTTGGDAAFPGLSANGGGDIAGIHRS